MLHSRFPKSSLAHLMNPLVERMVIEILPDTQGDAPTYSQNTLHFHQGGMPVTKEHQSKLAQDQVKAAIWEWELLSLARAPFNRQTLSLGHHTSHAEHAWIEIEAGDHALRSNVWGDVTGDDTCSARHIQDTLAQLHSRRPNQVR